jgi:hypothetical protein
MKRRPADICRRAWPICAAVTAVPALASERPESTEAAQALAAVAAHSPVPDTAAAAPAAKDKTKLSLSVDTSVFYDSNVLDGRWTAVGSADPGVTRPEATGDRKDEIGGSIGASASLHVPLAQGLQLVVDAGAYLLDFDGTEDDEASVHLAAGLSYAIDEKTRFVGQLTGSDRWYGQTLASAARGLRAQLSRELGDPERISLTREGCVLTSD